MPVDRRLLLLSPAAILPALSTSRSAGPNVAGSGPPPRVLSEFGAALNGTDDDSAALQRAVDACLSRGAATPLYIDGPCRIERSVFIDRPVDSTRGVFRIVGSGFGRFLVRGNIPLFDSRLEHQSEPTSEHIWFQNAIFDGVQSAPDASVMTGRFLRVQFHDCEFESIKALTSRIYAQEWHFSRCVAQRWAGRFFTSHGAYHVISSCGKYQNGGGAVFGIADPSLVNAGVVGCAFHQDVTESNSGAFLEAAVVQGLSVAGLYSEGNHGPTINLDYNAPNRGVSISGCMFAPKDEDKSDEAFFDIHWGRIEAGHASGNYSASRLHLHRASTADALVIAGDYAVNELSRRV